MLGRRTFHFRSIFAYHGLLVLAVLATAYISVRAQYEAMRDQQIEAARADQQQIVRSTAQRVQQQMRLLMAGMSTVEHDRLIERWAPQNWIAALGIVDAKSGTLYETRQGTPAQVREAIKSLPPLTGIETPTIGMTNGAKGLQLVMAVPMGITGRTAVAALVPDQMSQDLATAMPAAGSTQLFLTNDQGLVLAGTSSSFVGQWLQSKIELPLGNQLNTFYSTGNAGSALVEATDLSLIAEQPFDVTSAVRWHVVTLRTQLRESIRLTLRPLFWQLLTQASLTVIAMGIVLISTTTHLLRGRRRIERLRTEMLNRDLQKARRIQLNWLPAPLFKGERISIAAENRPASHISGDFYNWFDLPADEEDRTRKTVVVIGDVSGHGMPAAFLMATTQLMVSNTMPSLRDPGACLAEVNRQLCTLVYNGQFVTMMILIIDHDNGAIQIASAGHHAPLLKRDGNVEGLPIDPQLVLGVDESVEYQTHRLRTSPNDVLLLYTDGAIEASNAQAEQFGSDRLHEALAACDDEPEKILACVIEKLNRFHGAADQEDDLTLLALKLTPAPSAESQSSPASRGHEQAV